jgi:3-hydroxybutyryl-CoA dehydrogenase
MNAPRVTIVGSGYMGLGIGHVLALGGSPVRLVDTDAAVAEAALKSFLDSAAEFEEKGFFPAGSAAKIREISGWSASLAEGVADADLVMEAIPEIPDLKIDVFRQVEAAVRPDTVIATNTSAIPIQDLAVAFEKPERFLGIHWFNPAQFLPGVEVIPCEQTKPEIVQWAVEYLRDCGKEPAVVPDTPGFVCNRLQFALYKEAVRMVEEGKVSPQEIDTVVKASFGFRLALYGPFEVGDMAGLDVYANSYKSLERALGERYQVPQSLKERVERGDYGIKTGGGYLELSKSEAESLVAARDRAYVELNALRTKLRETAGD